MKRIAALSLVLLSAGCTGLGIGLIPPKPGNDAVASLPTTTPSQTPTNESPSIRELAGSVTTFFGIGSRYLDGPRNTASFVRLEGVTITSTDEVYAIDGNTIRRIDASGNVSTLAGDIEEGDADGIGREARFKQPTRITIDQQGNLLVVDTGNHRIRKITPDGTVSTLAGSTSGLEDGVANSAKFDSPKGIVVDASGNVFICDTGNSRIRKITPQGVVTTLAGGTSGFADGLGTDAKFMWPRGLAIDSNGNLYVADQGNYRIRKITPGGEVSTVAGGLYGHADGIGNSAQFKSPMDIACDDSGKLYVIDMGYVRVISSQGVVSTSAGASQEWGPNAIALRPDGGLILTDHYYYRLWSVSNQGEITSFAGIGTDKPSPIAEPSGICFDSSGNLIIARIRSCISKVTPSGELSTVAGITRNGNAYVDGGWVDGLISEARFSDPLGIAMDKGNNVYVADTGNNVIRKVTPNGTVSTFAGVGYGFADGASSSARFNAPSDVAVDSFGNVYVADTGNHRIRVISPQGEVSTLAGGTQGASDGLGNSAQFYSPSGLALDTSGNIFVADRDNCRIRKITPEGSVSTIAGSSPGFIDSIGPGAQFKYPTDVIVDYAGNVFVADHDNHRIRKVLPDGTVSTLAGGTQGHADGFQDEARFIGPRYLAFHKDGRLFVSDAAGDLGHTIRIVE